MLYQCNYSKFVCQIYTVYKETSNLSKAHVTHDSSSPATSAISVQQFLEYLNLRLPCKRVLEFKRSKLRFL